jgi:branched-chain amino acid transport system ATP-binding protein
MLEVKDLHVHYGNIRAVTGISLNVALGEIVCLIGANGAGKTTTLMAISGILPTVKGRITLDGKPIERIPSHKRVYMGVSQVPEGRHIFPHLTVLENLKAGTIGAADKSGLEHNLEHIYGLFPVLRDRRNQRGGTLSGGEQQMLAIGRALMAKPRYLLLDEPSLGLAPTIVRTLSNTFERLRDQGIGILMVEQNAKAALRISQRGYVIETGAVVIEGKAGELLENEMVKKAYLGH